MRERKRAWLTAKQTLHHLTLHCRTAKPVCYHWLNLNRWSSTKSQPISKPGSSSSPLGSAQVNTQLGQASRKGDVSAAAGHFSPDRIRNLCIIAHVDHGKSTLADRLMELTGTIRESKENQQILDRLSVERERGITVKAQSVTMFYQRQHPTILDHSTSENQTSKVSKTSSIEEESPALQSPKEPSSTQNHTTNDLTDSKTSKLLPLDSSNTAPEGLFMINLIDTPGHADFAYEVSRSMAACDGAILLVDANEGVQAQTVANFWLAFEANLTILPVLNKVDLPRADPGRVSAQLKKLFDIEPDEIVHISAKTGLNIADQLLSAIIDRLPPPLAGDSLTMADGEKQSADLQLSKIEDGQLSAFIFDSWFEQYHGSLASVLVKDGCLRRGQQIVAASTGTKYEVKEIGIMSPDKVPVNTLHQGQIGYLKCGMKTAAEARVGDTICDASNNSPTILPGFRVPKPVVFACLYPIEQAEHVNVQKALDRLILNDPAVTVEPAQSSALGQGWRLGFLGLLHLEVFNQRLDDEYDAHAVLTAPAVTFKAKMSPVPGVLRKYDLDSGGDRILSMYSASDFPLPSEVEEYLEPMVLATIVSPMASFDDVSKLCRACSGTEESMDIIDDDRVVLKYRLPLSEIIVNFYDALKRITSGYGSFDYEDAGYAPSTLCKLTVQLNRKEVEEFSQIVPASSARARAKAIGRRLRAEIPRQIIDVAIDVKINGRSASHHRIEAYKKDVTAKLYGGDITRRQKVLARQAAGKERLKQIHSVSVPTSAFVNVFKR